MQRSSLQAIARDLKKYLMSKGHSMVSGCVDLFLLEIIPACRKGTVSL